MAHAPAGAFITTFEDSRRWRHIERRSNDIIISSPPKSGTTWMQGIVGALIWPEGRPAGFRGSQSHWVDERSTPIEELVELVAAQKHRRFLKTHSPADCIPIDRRLRYIVVYRDGRDALVSWANHRAKLRPEAVQAFNTAAELAGAEPVPAIWSGDLEELFDEWSAYCSPVRHLASWWPHRHEPYVHFVHYADLLADLDGEMRRIADHLGIDVPSALWPDVVERCRIDSMRRQADADGLLDAAFEGGASAFFNQGVNGTWVDVLSAVQVDRYEALASDGLPPEAAAWLRRGSRAGGRRPPEIGVAPASHSARRAHPIFGPFPRAARGALEAITERRVDQARADGYFDNLSGAGKPIPDIDRQRPPGWFAARLVRTERNKLKAMQLEEALRRAMPALWRLENEVAVRARVAELNEQITNYNRVTTLQPTPALDVEQTLAQWRRLRPG